MKTFIKPFNAALITVIILICGCAVLWTTPKGEASNPRRAAAFGMFGVTAGQIARLNVANVCSSTEQCRARTMRLVFVNANGSPGGGIDSPLTQTVVTVEPGGSAFFDLPGSLLVGGNNRAQLRAVVEDLVSPTGVPPNPVIPSLEVIDAASSETVFHISNWTCHTTVSGCGGSNPFF